MDREISHEEGEKARRDLAALKEMVEGGAWKEFFLPLLEEKERERLSGLSSLSLDPAKRAEHLYGYHDAIDLQERVAKRLEELAKKVRQYNRQ